MLRWLKSWFGSAQSVRTTDWLPAVRPAWFALKNRETTRAVTLATPLLKRRNPIVVAQARRVLGLAHSRMGEYGAACEHLRAAAEQSDDALDWFNLATCAALAGSYDIGGAAIERAVARPWRSPHIQTMSSPQMRFHYMQVLADLGEHERAFGQLDEIRRIYQSFHSTAQDLLQFRKVPFLKRVLDSALPTLRAVRDQYDIDRWLDDFAVGLDRAGCEQLEQARRLMRLDGASSAPRSEILKEPHLARRVSRDPQ